MFEQWKLRPFMLRAQEAGISADEILEGSGLAWAHIEGEERLGPEAMAELMQHMARRTPPDFPIRWGHAAKVRDFGIVGYTMMSMPTLRQALEHWNRNCLVAAHPFITRLSEDGAMWRLEFSPRQAMGTECQQFSLEVAVAAMEAVIADITNAPANTVRIDFPFDPPATEGKYALLGAADIRFNQPAAAYYGQSADLDRALPGRDADISELLTRQCEKLSAIVSKNRPITEQIEEMLLESAGATPGLDEMAAKLRMSRRTLQRELQLHGATYQRLVERFRARHAITLLRERRLETKDIAYVLGFEDVGSFRRAFQRWTGSAVGEWVRMQGQA